MELLGIQRKQNVNPDLSVCKQCHRTCRLLQEEIYIKPCKPKALCSSRIIQRHKSSTSVHDNIGNIVKLHFIASFWFTGYHWTFECWYDLNDTIGTQIKQNIVWTLIWIINYVGMLIKHAANFCNCMILCSTVIFLFQLISHLRWFICCLLQHRFSTATEVTKRGVVQNQSNPMCNKSNHKNERLALPKILKWKKKVFINISYFTFTFHHLLKCLEKKLSFKGHTFCLMKTFAYWN